MSDKMYASTKHARGRQASTSNDARPCYNTELEGMRVHSSWMKRISFVCIVLKQETYRTGSVAAGSCLSCRARHRASSISSSSACISSGARNCLRSASAQRTASAMTARQARRANQVVSSGIFSRGSLRSHSTVH
eukprot:6177501-Pleurochrysis_carterae.AAC.1